MTGVTVHGPGPLRVIMAICEEIDLIETVNESVEWDESQCHISPDQRITVIIMNVLTEGVALYQMDDFFEQTDPTNLFTATDPTTEVTPCAGQSTNLPTPPHDRPL